MKKLKDSLRGIFKIYKRDIKNIITNYVAIIIIIGITVLPSLYAWFNIEASWDPYSNTKNLSVAVVNLDKGTEFRNVKINVGNEVISKLKSNQDIGWKFVNASEAENGVKKGKYYATITITKDFSKNLLSIVTEKSPKKSELIYTVNEKVNAIAPKITGKGASSLQEEVTKTFIKTASDTILSMSNQLGVTLENNKPQLKKLADSIIEIDNRMPEIAKHIDDAYSGSLVFKEYMEKVQGNTKNISDTLNKTINIAKTGDEALGKSINVMDNISPAIKSDLTLLKDTTNTAKTLLNSAYNFQNNSGGLRRILDNVSDIYSDGIKKINSQINLLNSLDKKLNSVDTTITKNGSKIIRKFISNLSAIKSEMSGQRRVINSIITTMDEGNEVLPESIRAAIQGADDIMDFTDEIINTFDTETEPAINDSLKDLQGISSNGIVMLENFQDNIPLIDSLLQLASDGVGMGSDRLKEIKEEFPGIQNDMHERAEKLRGLSDDEKINEIINILKRDAKAESEFLANPIEMKENKLFAIPNYGSAMAPFYTVLALWVGGLIALALLSVEVKSFEDGLEISPTQEFLGRYLTFVTIGIMQALVVTLGNLYLLKTYVIAPLPYVVFGVYTSIIFMMIIYTLVSVFGNVGKAIAMVVMVLQVAASGGTFPIQLTSPFFQSINPMLPFTYAIGGMRETVGGILKDLLIFNIYKLSVYFVISLVIGIFLKEKVNKIMKKFILQFKESGLAEH
ncbi:YhgE/Pip domain-containing protein [Clostridium sp. HMP27]|uniref:YhgE/Pip domain-containing protein n=1 Tax=Clostridium sp. HMP27 TaxID=1487921 RepID=UPI00052DC45D|nr:YhgE/Pip domain-containing protein [Clostridium sp. HMP27]KGK87922.1 hypothetical protein DP68_08250 [Clostridium sp. HMP27]